jgi:CubicO group peptidase (beta-lactamase class C family)
MNKFSRVHKSIIALILIMFIGVVGSATAQNTDFFTSKGEKVDIANFNKNISFMIDQVGIPGLSLAIIENNEVTFHNFYGSKNLRKKKELNRTSVFEAASLTKMYLVYVVHQLVEEGLIDLDKPMYEYLEYEPLEHDSRYKLITPRMIMSHSSGIENWRWNNNEDLLEILSDPGEQFVYSGEGFQYLAKVVELLLDESYESYINRLIIEPFELNQTFLKYKKRGLNVFRNELPFNYALGYNSLEEEVNKWKNYNTIPASGAHTTGEDYAKFLTAFFDKNNLSSERMADLTKPVVRLGDESSHLFMGAGFFMILTEKDTIVSFSGNNDGFKAELFYSIVHNRGFVFFANSDQGKLITKEINKLTTKFDIDFLFEDMFFKQYPSNAISLKKKYRVGGASAVLSELEKLKKEGSLDESTLNELGEMFKNKETELSIKLLKENILLFPESPNAYGLLASIYLKKKEYELARFNFIKAQKLNFSLWNVQEDIAHCDDRLKENVTGG